MRLDGELGASRVGLGTAGFAFGSATAGEARRVLEVAVDLGVALVDTARAYTRVDEESTAEAFLAPVLRAREPGSVFVATKGGHWRDGADFPVDGRPAVLRRHCESSLRVLGVDQIDLYQLHHVDPSVPIEESVAGLRDLQTAGMVRHIGLSNVSSEQLDAASGVVEIAAVQNRLSVHAPEHAELARECHRRDILFLAHSPLGGVGARWPRALEVVAARHACSPEQAALAWVLAVSPTIRPVVGATRVMTVRSSMAASAVHLAAADLVDLTRDPAP